MIEDKLNLNLQQVLKSIQDDEIENEIIEEAYHLSMVKDA